MGKKKTVKDSAFYSRIAKLRAKSLSGEERSAIASKAGKTGRNNMTAEERSAAAKHAAECRWGKKR